MAVLINEFGAVSVDGLVVAADRPELADIANLVDGCACCSLKADVVATLAAWCGLAPSVRPQRVVLETTGLADPTELVDLEEEPALAGRLRLAGCLTVISALTPLDHLARKQLVRHQAALASLVYVSKADLDPAMAMAWESQIRQAFPGHAVFASRLGLAQDGSPDPWAGLLPDVPRDAGPSFAQARALTLHWDHPVDAEALEALFLRPPSRGELLRAKGVCAFHGWPARHDGSDRWLFQLADGRLELSPLPMPASAVPAPMAAVVIGLDLAWSEWQGHLRQLERPAHGARHKAVLTRREP